MEQSTAVPTTGEAREAEEDRTDDSLTTTQEAADETTEATTEVHTDKPKIMEAQTPPPLPSRGDGPNNGPKVG